LAFSDNNVEKVVPSFSVSDAEVLINKIDASTSKKEKIYNFTPNERINLNKINLNNN
jgi:hypothetical protein